MIQSRPTKAINNSRHTLHPCQGILVHSTTPGSAAGTLLSLCRVVHHHPLQFLYPLWIRYTFPGFPQFSLHVFLRLARPHPPFRKFSYSAMLLKHFTLVYGRGTVGEWSARSGSHLSEVTSNFATISSSSSAVCSVASEAHALVDPLSFFLSFFSDSLHFWRLSLLSLSSMFETTGDVHDAKNHGKLSLLPLHFSIFTGRGRCSTMKQICILVVCNLYYYYYFFFNEIMSRNPAKRQSTTTTKTIYVR